MSKISKQRLRQIIVEEFMSLSEDVDHVAIKDVVSKAADLVTAIKEFKEEASPAMMNALTPHMESVERALSDMLSTPGSYVTAAKREPKKVSLSSQPNKDK